MPATMPLAPRLTQQSAVQLVLAGHLGLLMVMAAIHRNEVMTHHLVYGDFWTYQALAGGFFIGQIGLIALWAGLIPRSWTLRIGAMVLLIPLLALVQANVFEVADDCGWWRHSRNASGRYVTWVVAMESLAVPVFAVGIASRLFGLRIATPGHNGESVHRRVSILDAVGLLTLTGICSAFGKWLSDEGGWSRIAWEIGGWTLERSVAPLEFAALGCLLAALIYSNLNWRWILAALFVLPMLLGILDPLCFRPWFADSLNNTVPWEYYELTYTSFAFTLAANLFVFRDRGYRFYWRQRKIAPAAIIC